MGNSHEIPCKKLADMPVLELEYECHLSIYIDISIYLSIYMSIYLYV